MSNIQHVFITDSNQAATIEGSTLPNLRWLQSPVPGVRDKLQQAVQMFRGSEYWIEWRDVPTVEEL